jgi:hypothetical protein
MSQRVTVPIGATGDREPEAYLIAWADAADRFGTRDLHMQHKFAMADLKAVLLRHRIIAQ